MSFAYSVFLSHNSKDKPAVETIGKLLQQKYEVKCWLDKWNLVPGEAWQEALEKALDESETIAVFVGPNPISPWENEEMRSALEGSVHDKDRRVIPVLLPGAPDSRDLKLPRFLARMTWVDFRGGLQDEEALYRLYCGISGIKPGESRETPTSIAPHEVPVPPSPGTQQMNTYELLEALANPDPMVCLAAAKLLNGRSDICEEVIDIPASNPPVKDAIRSVLQSFPEKSAKLLIHAIKNSGETGEAWGRARRASEYFTPAHRTYAERELLDHLERYYDPEILRHTLTALGNIGCFAYYSAQVDQVLKSDYFYQKCLHYALEGSGRNFVLAETPLEIESASNHLLHLIDLVEKRERSVDTGSLPLGACSIRHVDEIMKTWLESDSRRVKKLGLEVLSHVRLTRSAARVLSIWHAHRGDDVGEKAAETLMCIGEQNSLKILLKHETKIIGEALTCIEEESFDRFLPQVLEDSRIAWLAYRAIGLRRRMDKLSLLKDGLSDTSPTVRGSAALALARLGERNGIKKAYEESHGEEERILTALAALTARLVDYPTVEKQLRLDLAERSFNYAIEAQHDILSALRDCGTESAEALVQAWKPFYGRGNIEIGISFT